MMLLPTEVAEFLGRQDEALTAFFRRHPELLATATRRDAQRRLSVGDRPLPSVGEVLAEADLVATREREIPTHHPAPSGKPPRPPSSKSLPASHEEFQRGAAEFLEEGRTGFRREAWLKWRGANPDVRADDPYNPEDS